MGRGPSAKGRPRPRSLRRRSSISMRWTWIPVGAFSKAAASAFARSSRRSAAFRVAIWSVGRPRSPQHSRQISGSQIRFLSELFHSEKLHHGVFARCVISGNMNQTIIKLVKNPHSKKNQPFSQAHTESGADHKELRGEPRAVRHEDQPALWGRGVMDGRDPGDKSE